MKSASPPSNPCSQGLAAADLLPLVYRQLRSLAHRYLREERADHTLQPTALVHEAYLRLADSGSVEWQGKTHFFAVAATQMRRILVDHARRYRASKRGTDRQRVLLRDDHAVARSSTIDVLALDEALERLDGRSPRQCRVAEMRLFSGMEFAEIADVLSVSERTARQDWKVARVWLFREFHAPGGG